MVICEDMIRVRLGDAPRCRDMDDAIQHACMSAVHILERAEGACVWPDSQRLQPRFYCSAWKKEGVSYIYLGTMPAHLPQKSHASPITIDRFDKTAADRSNPPPILGHDW